MLNHREFRDDQFWKELPGWKDVTKEQFADHMWQQKNSVRKIDHIKKILGSRVSDEFINDLLEGQKITPMNIRITPYVFALINWNDPVNDPLRKQFIPIGSQFLPDHPFYLSDSLSEDEDSPVPLLTHRYPDKVLFLPVAVCPVYCSYCTRSRVIGGSTETIDKNTYGASAKKWPAVFEYIRKNEAIEDVVISGGDAFCLTASQAKEIGETLLDIPNVRRIRYATKGVAIFPQKVLTDDAYMQALTDVHRKGKTMGKQVVIHTHFSCTNEITDWSKRAMERLFDIGITVRNQAVLQANVNDTDEEMVLLTKKLTYINVQSYYVYQHDMVQGCEHLRTTLKEGIELEKAVRGTVSGFMTPTFVCDLPGGGGKRHISSYEYYDIENGISVWKAPSVKPGKLFTYFDPIHRLSPEAQKRWMDSVTREQMVKDALAKCNA